MKKIVIANQFIDLVKCFPDGSIEILTKSEAIYSSFLSKTNQFSNTLDDGLEKIDESEPDVTRRFGFEADPHNRSIKFNGDIAQVLGFCQTYKLLSKVDTSKILETLQSGRNEAKRGGFFQWLKKIRSDDTPEESKSKTSFKKE